MTREFFTPHPNLGDEINRNICQSEIEGGVFLDDLDPGAVLEVKTQHRYYRLEVEGNGRAAISGHPKFCPEPVTVSIHGSTWRRSMLKMRFVGRGMCLEFVHPIYGVIHTYPIEQIRELPREQAMQPPPPARSWDDTLTWGR